MCKLFDFKLFIEEYQDYFDALEDEQGISWDNLVKSLELQPFISAHFKLNNVSHKLSAWQILNMNKNGALIKLKSLGSTPDRSYVGKAVNKSPMDQKTYFLRREDLIKFLTSGWNPALQSNLPSTDPGMGVDGASVPPISGAM